jgi:hypothetical protein
MTNYKTYLLVIFVIAAVLACSTKKAARSREGVAPTITRSFLEERPAAGYTILDYQGKNRGQPLPAWVELYLSGGTEAIEKTAVEQRRGAPVTQSEFSGKYVFVSVQKSDNLAALLQWKNNFSGEGDFSTMVFPRIYRRLVRGLSVNPERHYGSFFGEFMRLASNAAWPNLSLAGSIWITLSIPPKAQTEDTSASPPASGPATGGSAGDSLVSGGSPAIGGGLADFSGETNLVLMLLSVDKQSFERDLLRLFNRIPRAKTQSRGQRSAASRLESNFVEGF